MIKLALSGAQGRVGKVITDMLKEEPHFSLVAELLEDNQGLTTLDSSGAEVLIDFTVPSATIDYVEICCQKQLPMVIGTTGFSKEQKAHIVDASKKIPIVFAPNMSVGVNLALKVVEFLTKALVNEANISLVETHHKHKKDTPSGTALLMASVINEAAGKDLIDSKNIKSERLDEGAGQHTVLFSLLSESLEIKHKAADRSVYAKGSLAAARWLLNKEAGLYDMQDVLGLK